MKWRPIEEAPKDRNVLGKSEDGILQELKQSTNAVTKNSLEIILLHRCNRGDEEAGLLLYLYLMGWEN